MTTNIAITGLFGSPIDTTQTYYLVFYNSNNVIQKVLVKSISFSNLFL